MRTICSHKKNKSVKLPFVTKNSKHLVGTSGDDVSALIEFTPLWKTKVSKLPVLTNQLACIEIFLINRQYIYRQS